MSYIGGNMNIKYIYSKKNNKIIVIYDKDELYEINKIFHPFGVDVSSSLEVNHEKSIDKIKSFMKRIK